MMRTLCLQWAGRAGDPLPTELVRASVQSRVMRAARCSVRTSAAMPVHGLDPGMGQEFRAGSMIHDQIVNPICWIHDPGPYHESKAGSMA